MDLTYPNLYKNSQHLEDSLDHLSPECSENMDFFPNVNRVPITENLQTSQNSEKGARGEEVGVDIDHDTASEEGDNSEHSNQESKVAHSSLSIDEFVAQLRAIRVTRDREVELMGKKVEIMEKRLDLKLKREEMKAKKLHHMHLNTLLLKDHLSPEDEDIKCHLWAMLYGKLL